MTFVNSILRRLFDAALAPFSGLHPLVGITLISLIFGVVMLLVFKKTSNQDKLAAVKRKIHAGLFEIRLFNDDFGAIMRAQGDILRHNLSYFGLSLVPLAWMIVPLVLVIAQLQFHYGYQGLEPGAQALVKVELEAVPPEAGTESAPAARPPIQLQAPARLAKGFWNQLLYPAEDPLPEGPIRAITVTYPAGDAGFDGWENELTWMLFFFILSVVFAFALRRPLKVTI